MLASKGCLYYLTEPWRSDGRPRKLRTWTYEKVQAAIVKVVDTTDADAEVVVRFADYVMLERTGPGPSGIHATGVDYVMKLGFDVPGFAKRGDRIWECQLCRIGGFCTRAVIWVNPQAGKTFFLADMFEKALSPDKEGGPQRQPDKKGQERGTGALIEHEKGGTKARLSPFPQPGAYESDTTIDHDPNTESALFGYDSGLMDDDPIYLFLETARDIVANTAGMVSLNTYENRGSLHETLHQFLGPHSADPNNPSNPVADEGVRPRKGDRRAY